MWKFLIDLIREIDRDDCLGHATRIAYSALFSVVPFLIVIIAVMGYVGLNDAHIDRFVERISEILPPIVKQLIESNLKTIFQEAHPKAFSIGLIFMLWGSTNALSSILLGIDTVSKGHSNRPFYTRRGIALLMVIVFGIVSGGLMLVLIISHNVISIIDVTYGQIRVLDIVRWPVSSILTFVSVLLLYYIAPKERPKLRIILPGAIFFTIVWQLSTYWFTLYIKNVGTYSLTFGMLGTILVTMVWFYISGLILLIGGEINYLAGKKHRLYSAQRYEYTL